MIVKKLAQLGILSLVFCFQIHAMDNKNYQSKYDKESLINLKYELEDSKKILLEIRNSISTGILTKSTNMLGSVIKELLYIGTSIIFGGGSIVLGATVILGKDNVQNMLENPFAQGTLLMGLPIIGITTLITYTSLKLIFGKLLASSANNNFDIKDIKETILLIDQIVRKINRELSQIETLIQN